jgi:hypothetical protein
LQYSKELPIVNLQTVRDRPGAAISLGAMAVSLPRWVDAFSNGAGFAIQSPMWDAIHAASGAGMVAVEALTIAYCAGVLSRHGKRSLSSGALLGLLAAAFLSMVIVVVPVLVATARKVLVVNLLDDAAMWLWSLALSLSTLIAVGATGIAEHLSSAKPGSMPGAVKPQPAKPVNVDTVQAAPQAVPQVNVGVSIDNRSLTLSESTAARIIEIVKRDPDASQVAIAQALGITRQAVNQHVKALKSAGTWPVATGIPVVMAQAHQEVIA